MRRWVHELAAASAARTAQPERGERRPLLFYQQLNERNFWPSLLIIILSAALLVWNPAPLAPYRLHWGVVLAGTGLLLVLTFLLRLRGYVQCRPEGLRVQLSFYRLTIPYPEIKNTRPTNLAHLFPLGEQHWTQRLNLRPLLGWTVIVIEMEHLPRPRPWLRLWMSKYMLCPHEEGLALPVRDWIAFRTELDEFRSRQRLA